MATEEDGCGDQKCQQWDKEGKPERAAGFHVDGNKGRQCANVNNPVKPHEHPLDCHLWIHQDMLSRLERLKHGFRVLVLLSAHWGHVCLDSPSSQANYNHCGDDATHASSVEEGAGERCRDKDQQTDDVDATSYQDRLELPEVLVCAQISPWVLL